MRKTEEGALGIYSGWVRVSFSPWPPSLIGANYGYLDTGDLGFGKVNVTRGWWRWGVGIFGGFRLV